MTTLTTRRLRPRLAWSAALLAALAVLLVSVVGFAGDASGETERRDVLTWNVDGRATVELTWPGPEACGGALCVELGNGLAVAADRVGCLSLGRATFGVRCGLNGIRTLRVVGSGNLPVVVNSTAPAAGCPPIDVVIAQGSSNGATNVQDGCRQTVECAVYYSGTVHADSTDVVADGCTNVRVDGNVQRVAGTQEPCKTPGRGCVPDRGATPSIPDTKPITDPTDPQHAGPSGRAGAGALRVVSSSGLSRSGRALRARVTITQPAQVGVTLQRRTPKGRWVTLRTVSRTAEKGRTSVVFRSTRKRPIGPGTYRTRVTVSAPGTTPVISRALRVRG
ncbi:MAG: hypothetical protein WC558_15900 [Patulibacter sp.]